MSAGEGGARVEGTVPTRPESVPDQDWPAQAANSITDLVDQVRDKTTGRAVTAARGIVFGVLILVVVSIGLIALVVGLVRGTQVGLENLGVARSTAVWASYLIVGAVFALVEGGE